MIGATIRFALVERFCRVLASMAGAGVALPEALRVATESLRNLVFIRALWIRSSEAMLRGRRAGGAACRAPSSSRPPPPG